MKPLLNLDEPVQRRTGEPAEILRTNAKGPFPIIALTTVSDGRSQVPDGYTLRGSWTVGGDDVERPNDLINVPKKGPAEGTLYIRCYLMEDGRIEAREGTIPTALEGSSRVIGARAFRLAVKRGEWI